MTGTANSARLQMTPSTSQRCHLSSAPAKMILRHGPLPSAASLPPLRTHTAVSGRRNTCTLTTAVTRQRCSTTAATSNSKCRWRPHTADVPLRALHTSRSSVRLRLHPSRAAHFTAKTSSTALQAAPRLSPTATQCHTTPTLVGSCTCGSTGFTASGASQLNAICHCSICRAATSKPSTAFAGFVPAQVQWKNSESIERKTPEGSQNPRYYCKNCRGYIGEDATQSLGLIALPLSAVTTNLQGGGHVADCYKPNHHVFYANRVKDESSTDNLPKWKTVVDSEIMGDNAETIAAAHRREQRQHRLASQHASQLNGNTTSHYDSTTGIYRKDLHPMSPARQPEPGTQHFTTSELLPNNVTQITLEQHKQRINEKYNPANHTAYVAPKQPSYDIVIVGAGHNGLVSACYLAEQGLKVLVLERRHLVGGAAVTEELYEGYKFSRFSYLAGLMRPQIIRELQLEKHGFKYLSRTPSSFTPTRLNSAYEGKYLLLGQSDSQKDLESIAQFSERDAESYLKYEEFLNEVRDLVQPLLDGPPPMWTGNRYEKQRTFQQVRALLSKARKHRKVLASAYELLTAPATQILDRYFESEILKTTLATDSVIGSMMSPRHAGSAYVLLHHVMGESAGRQGVWSYSEGGMGRISEALAGRARELGVEIVCNAQVQEITYSGEQGAARATGVRMNDGSVIAASKAVLSNATPFTTFLELLPGLPHHTGASSAQVSPLPSDFVQHIRFTDYSSGVAKINLAVDKLPNFECFPSPPGGAAGDMHRGTIHFESSMQEIEDAQREASAGVPASQPVIEMTIPSSVDRTVAPEGKHVVQLFIQYAPYRVDPKLGSWKDPRFKQSFADRIYSVIDEFAPGFSSSILYQDVLSPLDIERIVGLQGGNIFHSALSLSQLGYARPAPNYSRHRTPMRSLYLCGSGAHPGGGVMGSAGKNCAQIVLSDLNIA